LGLFFKNRVEEQGLNHCWRWPNTSMLLSHFLGSKTRGKRERVLERKSEISPK
jgi:hypothetical protein